MEMADGESFIILGQALRAGKVDRYFWTHNLHMFSQFCYGWRHTLVLFWLRWKLLRTPPTITPKVAWNTLVQFYECSENEQLHIY